MDAERVNALEEADTVLAELHASMAARAQDLEERTERVRDGRIEGRKNTRSSLTANCADINFTAIPCRIRCA